MERLRIPFDWFTDDWRRLMAVTAAFFLSVTFIIGLAWQVWEPLIGGAIGLPLTAGLLAFCFRYI